MSYLGAGYYNFAPEFIDFSRVGMQALKGLADSMGMSVGDLQSQMQNYSRFVNSLYGTAGAPGSGGGGDWFDQWDASKTTMKDWIDQAGGENKNIYEPADRLYNYWMQDAEKTLQDHYMSDPNPALAAGDASPMSATHDATRRYNLQQALSGLQASNRRGSTEPWFQGVYQGYSNYLSQGTARAQLALQAMQGYFGQLMNPYNSILQANAGGYGGGMVKEQTLPPNIMGMSAGGGGMAPEEEKNPTEEALKELFNKMNQGGNGVGTPSTGGGSGSSVGSGIGSQVGPAGTGIGGSIGGSIGSSQGFGSSYGGSIGSNVKQSRIENTKTNTGGGGVTR